MLLSEEVKMLPLWFVIPEETTTSIKILSKVLHQEIKRLVINKLWKQEEIRII
jgi:hypothetical protein